MPLDRKSTRLNSSHLALHDALPISYDEMEQLTLAYVTTIHKSQGSEFPAVVIPVVRTHYRMLQRNLLYTAVTRAKRLVVLVGQKEAVRIAVRNAIRSEEHTSELQSPCPTRRSSDLLRRDGAAHARVRDDHSQEPGERVPGRGHPGRADALPDVAAQPALHGGHARQASGGAGRSERGRPHRGPECH